MKNILKVLGGHQVMFREYPDVVDVDKMRRMLGGIGRRTAYRLLQNGDIKSVKIGRSYRIPKMYVIDYLCQRKVETEYSQAT